MSFAARSSLNSARVPPTGGNRHIFGPVTEGTELKIGELRRRVHLGTEAIYRVCDWDEELAEVEVVQAPGLRPGQRFRFDVAAVRSMVVVPPGATRELS
ncbi:MAG: hypothetical protein ACRDPA_15955 [Solirubrobacteraceae bacterium]